MAASAVFMPFSVNADIDAINSSNETPIPAATGATCPMLFDNSAIVVFPFCCAAKNLSEIAVASDASMLNAFITLVRPSTAVFVSVTPAVASLLAASKNSIDSAAGTPADTTSNKASAKLSILCGTCLDSSTRSLVILFTSARLAPVKLPTFTIFVSSLANDVIVPTIARLAKSKPLVNKPAFNIPVPMGPRKFLKAPVIFPTDLLALSFKVTITLTFSAIL